MKFTLRRPCPECPFRTDIRPYLSRARVEDILASLLRGNMTFSCHKHLSGRTDEDDDGEALGYRPGDRDQHCVGALLLVESEGAANAMIQIAERFRLYDPDRLERPQPVYKTASAMIEACTQ